MRKPSIDNIAHLAFCGSVAVNQCISSLVTRIIAKWWGIRMSRGCHFYGLPIFRRHPNSRILIEQRNEFRSAPWSNLAGLNRKCIISTLTDDAIIRIGEGGHFSGTVFAAAKEINIGKGVYFGANTSIFDTDWHAISAVDRARCMPGKSSPVIIEDDVWLGMNVIVLKGVHIGAGTVVAANSVVTQSLPSSIIAGGNPARFLYQIQSAGKEGA